MANTKAYLAYLADHMAELGEVTSRAMMGGHVLYLDGTVFALVDNNELYLKADRESRPAFEQRGLPAFRPFEDQTATMDYFRPPPEFFEDGEAMLQWGRLAVAAGRKPKTRKKPAKRAAKRQ